MEAKRSRARVGTMTFVGLVVLAGAAMACARSATPTTATKVNDTLTIAGALDRNQLPAGVGNDVIARIVIEARPSDRRARPPVNLALVVDTSGSMEGRAIEDARAASTALLDSMSPDDRLAIVTFNSKTELLLPTTKMDDADAREVRAKIRAMKAEGTTAMADGLAAGIAEVSKNLDAEGIHRVILLGDGIPNNEAGIEAMAHDAGARNISVTVLGLGVDYNESLMGRVAQASGGRFHYVEDSTKVLSFFEEEIVRLQKVAAKNATIELSPGPGVTVEGVIGQQTTPTGRGVMVRLGDLAVGDRRELVVRLKVAAHKDGGAVELLDSVIRSTDAVGGASSEHRLFLGAHATSDVAKVLASKNDDVERSAAKAKDAAATLEEIQRARDSDRPGGAPPHVMLREPMRPQGAGAPRSAPISPAPEAAMPSPVSTATQADAKLVRARHDFAMRTLQGE